TGTGTGTAAGDNAGGGDNAGTQVADAGNTPQNNGPQEIVDLDDQQTPLAQYDNGEENNDEVGTASVNSETEGVVRAQGMSTPAKILLALAIILALGGAGWFLFRRFAQDADDDDEEDEDYEE
ncbi:MAG: hypothetical protein Q4F43_08290, partial [Eubacteriales bacterium]|nr:hypothetical protein [Eubacteriales bacterium]